MKEHSERDEIRKEMDLIGADAAAAPEETRPQQATGRHQGGDTQREERVLRQAQAVHIGFRDSHADEKDGGIRRETKQAIH